MATGEHINTACDDRHKAICPQCDWVMQLAQPRPGQLARCPRCNHVVAQSSAHRISDGMGWALAALILLLLVFGFDFLGFDTRGIGHTMSFIDAMQVLATHGYPILATVFILTTAILPGLFLLAVVYMTGAAQRTRSLPFAIPVARLACSIRMWLMSDVFIVGILVSLIKIVSLASISFGASFMLFCLFSLLLLKTMNTLEWAQLWRAIAGPARMPSGLRTGRTGSAQHAALCSACGAPYDTRGDYRCRRCGRRHWLQRVSRLQLTWALLITALLLYIPANIYPIMVTRTLTGSEGQTIAGGVQFLIASGSWPIALIIFLASIVVPLTKIAALAWLCLCGHYGLHHDSRAQARLYRVTELIGRWSMIDVFVVTVLAALVQAAPLMSVRPGPAAVPFAAVVIITMLAAETFDTHLLWQRGGRHD